MQGEGTFVIDGPLLADLYAVGVLRSHTVVVAELFVSHWESRLADASLKAAFIKWYHLRQDRYTDTACSPTVIDHSFQSPVRPLLVIAQVFHISHLLVKSFGCWHSLTSRLRGVCGLGDDYFERLAHEDLHSVSHDSSVDCVHEYSGGDYFANIAARQRQSGRGRDCSPNHIEECAYFAIRAARHSKPMNGRW